MSAYSIERVADESADMVIEKRPNTDSLIETQSEGVKSDRSNSLNKSAKWAENKSVRSEAESNNKPLRSTNATPNTEGRKSVAQRNSEIRSCGAVSISGLSSAMDRTNTLTFKRELRTTIINQFVRKTPG